jgi:hypothetical protein
MMAQRREARWLAYFSSTMSMRCRASAKGSAAAPWMGGSSIKGVGRIAMLTDPQGAPF